MGYSGRAEVDSTHILLIQTRIEAIRIRPEPEYYKPRTPKFGPALYSGRSIESILPGLGHGHSPKCTLYSKIMKLNLQSVNNFEFSL